MGGRTDPCRLMDIQADIVPGHDQWLPGMNADPYADRPLRQRGLHLARSVQRVRCAPKRDKESVPLGPELKPTVSRNHATDPLAMQLQLRAVLPATQPLQEPRRALDIGKQKSHRPHGQLSGRGNPRQPTNRSDLLPSKTRQTTTPRDDQR